MSKEEIRDLRKMKEGRIEETKEGKKQGRQRGEEQQPNPKETKIEINRKENFKNNKEEDSDTRKLIEGNQQTRTGKGR